MTFKEFLQTSEHPLVVDWRKKEEKRNKERHEDLTPLLNHYLSTIGYPATRNNQEIIRGGFEYQNGLAAFIKELRNTELMHFDKYPQKEKNDI